MSKLRIALIALLVSIAGLVVVLLATSYLMGDDSALQKDSTVDELILEVTQRRLLEEEGGVDFGTEKEINILLIGLDQRKDWDNPHCDAIHMFTLDLENWTMEITSVPRGTYAYIPRSLPETEYYLANTCSYEGLDYGIKQMEKIIGRRADYYATVNFSQVIGIMRMLDLPTTESLQWLRHRQSYAIGDPQRSHNQAVFMKDLILSQFHRFEGDFSLPVMYAMFQFIDTDMSFTTAKSLVRGYLESKIYERPEDIVLSMKPYHETVDYHFDLENPDAQIEALLRRIRPYLSDDDLSDRSLEEVQAELVAYLEEQLEGDALVDSIVARSLWMQIEDEAVRNDLHYRYVEEYVYSLIERDRKEDAIEYLTSYIIEVEAFGLDSYATRGRGLMQYIAQ